MSTPHTPVREKGLLLKPKRTVNADDTLSPAEAKQVRRGIKQIKEGRFTLWRDVKHELDS